MKTAIVLFALFGLAACGADGAPSASRPGVAVSGDVAVGVVVNPNELEATN